MKHALTVTLVLGALGAVACGSNEGVAQGSGGAGGTLQDASGDADAAPLPCEPEGRWLVEYTPHETGPHPGPHTLAIIATDAGMDVHLEDEAPESACGSGGSESELLKNEGSFDPSACRVTASWHATWCQSGESQFRRLELSLQLGGDAGQGELDYEGGNFSNTHEAIYEAQAKRLPP